jgi:hypothetical protein
VGTSITVEKPNSSRMLGALVSEPGRHKKWQNGWSRFACAPARSVPARRNAEVPHCMTWYYQCARNFCAISIQMSNELDIIGYRVFAHIAHRSVIPRIEN